MIAAEYQAKDAARKARLAKLDEATVKSEGRGVLPGGRGVIVREVEPPKTVPVETDPPQTQVAPTPEQIANFEAYTQKEHHSVMLSATVYDRSITKLRWTHELVDYVAYTNADFNYLRGLHSVSTETDEYFFLMGIGDEANDAMQELPNLPVFSSDQSEYFVAEGDSANAIAFQGVEALLTHYDANKPALITAYQRQEALNVARARYKAANPEPKEDFILQFWVPEPANGKTQSE